MIVLNLVSMRYDFEHFKQMFPRSHTSMETITQTLEERKDDPVGSIFGVSVADVWEDKCYAFSVKQNGEYPIFEYFGIKKV